MQSDSAMKRQVEAFPSNDNGRKKNEPKKETVVHCYCKFSQWHIRVVFAEGSCNGLNV